MHVRLGKGIDGETVSMDTSRDCVIVLLGDPSMGKTTLSRYLVRWSLARTDEQVLVSTARRDEWADLASCHRLNLGDLTAEPKPGHHDTERSTGLWVIDGLDNIDSAFLVHLSGRARSTIVTALSAWGSEIADSHVEQWGLVVQSCAHPAASLELAIPDPTQSRLDWGPETRALLPDLRGPADYPRHRWHAIDRQRSSVVGVP